MRSWIQVGTLSAALLCTSSVWADEGQEACERAVAEMEAKDEVVELVSDDVIIAKVRFQKDYSSRFASHGPYVEKETRINKGGREMEFLNSYACNEDGELILNSSVALDETLPTIRWKKGLPVLKFPLYDNPSWSWEGTHYDVIYGSDSKAGGSAAGYVVGFETILDGAGNSLSTVHVRLNVRWGKGSDEEHQIIDAWYAQSPLRLVKRDVNDVAQGRTVRLEPSSMGGTQTTTTPKKNTGEKVIILKTKIE